MLQLTASITKADAFAYQTETEELTIFSDFTVKDLEVLMYQVEQVMSK